MTVGIWQTQYPSAFSELGMLQFKLQYTRKEAAFLGSVSLRSLDRMIATKQLNVKRIGRRVLIARDALMRFMRSDHQTTSAVTPISPQDASRETPI